MKPVINQLKLVIGNRQSKIPRGFTQVDLICLAAVVGLLVSCLVWTHSGERARQARCRANLKQLSLSFHGFALDHGGALPPATIDVVDMSWDKWVMPYLGGRQTAKNVAPGKVDSALIYAAMLHCPNQLAAQGSPRTYVMPVHDMADLNWPPGAHNTTGLGLTWSDIQLKRKLGAGGLGLAKKNPEALALLKLAALPAPADTLLLAEWGREDNQVGSRRGATVKDWETQRDLINQKPTLAHPGGRLNYLMADGHVELLLPLQTGIIGAPAGIWTIEAGD
jgi:prepilin-type processing-associated H-X9-DG protein